MEEKVTVDIVGNLTEIKGLTEFTQSIKAAAEKGYEQALANLTLSKGKYTRYVNSARALEHPEEVANKRTALHKAVLDERAAQRRMDRAQKAADALEKALAELEEFENEGLDTTNSRRFTALSVSARRAVDVLQSQDMSRYVSTSSRVYLNEMREALTSYIAQGRAVSRSGKKYNKDMEAWVNFRTNQKFGGDLIDFLEDPDVDQKEKQKAARRGYSLLSRAVASGMASGSLDKEDIKNTREGLNYLEKIKDNTFSTAETLKSGGGGSIMSSLSAGVRAGAFSAKVTNSIIDYIQRQLANTNDPKSQAALERAAMYRKFGTAAGIFGGAASGALAGATLGSSVPVLGTVAGAVVGGLAGGVVGPILGSIRQNELVRGYAVQQEAIQGMRWRALYGDTGGNAMFARLAEKTGYVSAGDIEGLASTGSQFLTAAAFGGISDQQWMGLSMLPHYFAALSSGEDSPEVLLQAYREDMKMYPKGMGQYFTSMVPGLNENIRALVESEGTFGKMMADAAWFGNAEHQLYQSGAYPRAAVGYYNRGRTDLAARVKTGMDVLKSRDPNIVDNTLDYGPSNKVEGSENKQVRGIREGVASAVKEVWGEKNYVPTEINLIIDGETKATASAYIAGSDLQDWETFAYSVGGQ